MRKPIYVHPHTRMRVPYSSTETRLEVISDYCQEAMKALQPLAGEESPRTQEVSVCQTQDQGTSSSIGLQRALALKQQVLPQSASTSVTTRLPSPHRFSCSIRDASPDIFREDLLNGLSQLWAASPAFAWEMPGDVQD